MARRRSSKQIPADYSIGKNVFPVIPLRKQLVAASVIGTSAATIVAGNVGEEVQLDLDFESNEVFDVLAIQYDMTKFIAANAGTNPSDMTSQIALCDDPDKADATNINDNDIFEGDSSFVWYRESVHQYLTAVDASNVVDSTTSGYFIFEQPWTVARNLKWIASQFSTAAADFTAKNRMTIWGRRRNASDDEFKSIIYRQRF